MYSSTEKVARSLRAAGKARKTFGRYVDQLDYGFTDYVINVVYDRYALGGRSYSIRFYLERDDASEIGIEIATKKEENFVGEIYTFGGMTASTDDEPGCANCSAQQAAGVLSRAQVPITIPLLSLADNEDFATFNDVKRDTIEPYLKKHLHWKIVGHGGVEYDEADFPQTQIHIYAGLSQSVPATDLQFSAPTADGDASFSTPLFGIDQGYKPLFDAVKQKRIRSGVPEDSPEMGISALAITSDGEGPREW